MTLTEFVTKKLSNIPSKLTDNSLGERLTKIEKLLNLDQHSSNLEPKIGSVFTDQGAKKYGEVAKALLNLHRKKKDYLLNCHERTGCSSHKTPI